MPAVRGCYGRAGTANVLLCINNVWRRATRQGAAGGPCHLAGVRPLAAVDLALHARRHPRTLTTRRAVPGSASFTLSRQIAACKRGGGVGGQEPPGPFWLETFLRHNQSGPALTGQEDKTETGVGGVGT